MRGGWWSVRGECVVVGGKGASTTRWVRLAIHAALMARCCCWRVVVAAVLVLGWGGLRRGGLRCVAWVARPGLTWPEMGLPEARPSTNACSTQPIQQAPNGWAGGLSGMAAGMACGVWWPGGLAWRRLDGVMARCGDINTPVTTHTAPNTPHTQLTQLATRQSTPRMNRTPTPPAPHTRTPSTHHEPLHNQHANSPHQSTHTHATRPPIHPSHPPIHHSQPHARHAPAQHTRHTSTHHTQPQPTQPQPTHHTSPPPTRHTRNRRPTTHPPSRHTHTPRPPITPRLHHGHKA